MENNPLKTKDHGEIAAGELVAFIERLASGVSAQICMQILNEFVESPDSPLRAIAAPILLKRALESGKSGLPIVTQSLHIASVTPTFEDLMARLTLITATRGKKAELARHLDVRMPQLYQWMSGKRHPNGTVTLQMLAWVQAEEAKQKSPASAQTPAGPKTRPKQNNDELRKSSPQAS